MSARCETCKHWLPQKWDDVEVDPATRWGECGYIVGPQHWEDEDGPSAPNASVSDASDYKAWLSTRADFGCVLHEPSAVGATGDEPSR